MLRLLSAWVLCENRKSTHHINVLRSNIFAGARHAVPLPQGGHIQNFMNMKLRVHHAVCPRRAWEYYGIGSVAD